MATERENDFSSIVQIPYNIDGNVFRAYADASGNLLFVVDETVTADKPNVTLVMDDVAGRKWDDVLSNDYGVDLETIRPRRDNKYQKLDIEYTGLDVYRALIAADAGDGDMAAARSAMARFRIVSARRMATERLDAALDTSDKARETVARTTDTIAELQARIKELRAKVSQHKKAIGREPTKQTASKILKAEAQIDATNEKLARAKKRLAAARRRMVTADENAEIARAILARVADADVAPADTVTAEPTVALPAAPVFTDVAVLTDAPVPATQQITESEPRTEEMPDDKEEVKPLFEKDPEILDEEIAFKPIDFNVGNSAAASASAPRATTVPETAIDIDDTVAPAPLAFTPPTRTDETVAPARENTPVLETITSVDAPVVEEPVAETIVTETVDVAPVTPVAVEPAPQPMPDVSPAPADSGFRPVSPLKKNAAVAPVDPGTRKPTLAYYIMLIVLIVLSIFTLWIYQKSNRDTTPDLAASIAPQPAVETVVDDASLDGDSPFLSAAPAAAPVAEQQPDVMPEPEPELEIQETIIEEDEIIPEPEPEPVPVIVVPVEEIDEIVEPEFEDVAVIETDYDIVEDSPFLAPVEEPKHIPTEEEVLATKPAYNVSQQENMFVADDNYDTETLPAVGGDVMDVASADFDMPACGDGSAPNLYGCCPGEEYTDMGEAGFNCCPADGGDCFPPLF